MNPSIEDQSNIDYRYNTGWLIELEIVPSCSTGPCLCRICGYWRDKLLSDHQLSSWYCFSRIFLSTALLFMNGGFMEMLTSETTSIIEPRRGSSTNLQAGLVWQDIFVPTFLTRWCCVHLLYIKMECRLHTYIKDIHLAPSSEKNWNKNILPNQKSLKVGTRAPSGL